LIDSAGATVPRGARIAAGYGIAAAEFGGFPGSSQPWSNWSRCQRRRPIRGTCDVDEGRSAACAFVGRMFGEKAERIPARKTPPRRQSELLNVQVRAGKAQRVNPHSASFLSVNQGQLRPGAADRSPPSVARPLGRAVIRIGEITLSLAIRRDLDRAVEAVVSTAKVDHCPNTSPMTIPGGPVTGRAAAELRPIRRPQPVSRINAARRAGLPVSTWPAARKSPTCLQGSPHLPRSTGPSAGSDPQPAAPFWTGPATSPNLLDGLDVNRFAVMGWSLGGQYAAAVKLRAAASVTRGAIIDGHRVGKPGSAR